MKKLYFLLLFITGAVMAQIPQGFSYQAVALNSGGQAVASSPVKIRLSILEGSATGTATYTETHNPTTNSVGLFTLTIGQGTPVSGTFSGINWAQNSKFLKVEIDVNNGANYITVGTSQLLSVPYAMYAENVSTGGMAGTGTSTLKNSSFAIVDGYNVHAFSNGTWATKNCTGYPDEIIESDGNFAVIDGTSVYAFSNGAWATQNCSGYPDETIESNGNFAVIDGTSVYAFSNGAWATQNCSGYPDQTIESNGNFVIVDGYNIHAFSNGNWTTQNCSGYPDQITASNGNIIVTDGYNIHVFSNGNWTTQNCSGYPDQVIISETN